MQSIVTVILMLEIMGVALDGACPAGICRAHHRSDGCRDDHTATGKIGGASLNPARTSGSYFGDWLPGGPDLRALFPIYIIGPVAGAVLAAVFYDQMTREEK